MSPRMRTNVHCTLLPPGPGDYLIAAADAFEVSGPLSPISCLSSPAKLTSRPRALADLSPIAGSYSNSLDWTVDDFDKMIKTLNISIQLRPRTDASYRSPRQYAVAKTWGVDGSTGSGSPVLRKDNIYVSPQTHSCVNPTLYPCLHRIGARHAYIRIPSHSYGILPSPPYGISHMHMCMLVCE